ncbi:MAG: hypothetical protein M1827_000460 [Pycnora praestabilis]|nr:MAG: hypothetical protein M1827_000460 [Pycnora praestabilis]
MASDRKHSSTSDRQSIDRPSLQYGRKGRSKTAPDDVRRPSRAFEFLNEQSPLLIPQRGEDEENLIPPLATPLGELDNEEREDTKSMWYLILLTIPIGGLQIAWSVELSNGTPYLLSLGLSKSLLALVWIAGPLSGTLVQPYVGIRSDNCRISWGKRKPFMIFGALATILSLLALAWAREIVHGVLSAFGADPASEGVKIFTIIFAVAFVYILDFAINVGKLDDNKILGVADILSSVQAGTRAYFVDNAPTHQQEQANAWAGRITGFGNVLGYLSGYVDLPRILPFFGKTEFQILCTIACLALSGTLAISCSFIKERDPRTEGPPAQRSNGVLAFFKHVFKSIKRLPPQIRKVCEVQFFAWIGWFPFLFYITTYVGGLYAEPHYEANPHMTPAEIDAVWERATRIGTFALLIFAITSLTSNIVLPLIVAPSYQPPTSANLSASFVSLHSFNSRSSEKRSFTKRLLNKLTIPWLTLRRTWFLAHLLFALTMWLTLFVHTTQAATALIGLVGVSWALTLWAPYALISAEISKRDAIRRGQLRDPEAIIDDDCEDQAGIILGLHNVAIAAPQIIATLGSSAIFRILQKPRGSTGDDSVGWVLRIGGLAALIAAYMTLRVGEERRDKDIGDEDSIRR